MARIVAPMRGRKASKRLDVTGLREALADRRIWAQLAVVAAPAGASSHWELVADQQGNRHVLVDVETVPRRIELRCRLGAGAGGLGQGLWRIPAIGTEVAILVPDGQIDFQPVIVACLDSGAAPERLEDGRTILVATDTVEITAPKVVLGPGPEGMAFEDGLLSGRATDPYTGLTHAQLGNGSTKVFGAK
jgi:hypothetical protein